jgi:hypothetical protein
MYMCVPPVAWGISYNVNYCVYNLVVCYCSVHTMLTDQLRGAGNMSPDFMKNCIDFPFHINICLPSPPEWIGMSVCKGATNVCRQVSSLEVKCWKMIIILIDWYCSYLTVVHWQLNEVSLKGNKKFQLIVYTCIFTYQMGGLFLVRKKSRFWMPCWKLLPSFVNNRHATVIL